jgi:hypothetical protein
MHQTCHFLLTVLTASAALSACSGKVQAPAAQPQAVQGATRLLGQWNGPEGSYIQIGGANGKYAITIRNLDGPRTFQGSGAGDTVSFARDGKQHTIRPSDGAATGMKWLADKKNCVTIEPGEGYCRD